MRTPSAFGRAVCLAVLVLLGAPAGARAAPARAAWPTPIALGKEGIYSEFNDGIR